MIILDACIVISFGTSGHFDLIDGLRTDTVCIGSRARSEVLRDPAHSALEASIRASTISVESVDLLVESEQKALQLYDARAAFRGRGDAEVLALGASRSYVVASDENAIRSVVIKERGARYVAGTLDFIIWAVREGRMTVAEGEAALTEIDSGKRILLSLSKSGKTLADLI